MSSNPFSQGKITASSITIAGRFCNRICALACSNKIKEIIGDEITDENRSALTHIAQVDTDSFYINLTQLMKHGKFNNLSKSKKIELAVKLSQGILQDVINETIQKIGVCLNLKEPSALSMENEVITSGFVSLAAKRYFCRVEVNDGNILAKPKMKVTGVSLVSYSTPQFLKDKLKPVLDIVLDKSAEDLRNYIRESREDFGSQDPLSFVRTAKVNNLGYKLYGGKYKRQKEDGKWLTAPLGSTSALEHNRLVKELNITGRFPLITRGESINYVYTKVPNKYKFKGSIGFSDPKFSSEINLREIADYDTHWQKDFLDKINIIVKPLKWNVYQTTEVLDCW